MTGFLDVNDLHAAYGPVEVLHGISFAMDRGEILAVLGANGAGKTTTLRAISALVPAEGKIELDGVSLIAHSTHQIARLGVAHVPDGRGTIAELTVRENLYVGGYRQGPAQLKSSLELVYSYFPRLQERTGQQAGTLSGGEQQMLAIGRALMSKPRLLLLDEPSFGVAPLVVNEIFSVLAAINRQESLTIVLVEQNTGMALSIAHRACLLENGRLIASGKSAELAEMPIVRSAYLGSAS